MGDATVGRVIARPFVGPRGGYTRTTNRRDFSVPPAGPTVLDVLTAAGVATTSIGKVDDLFAGRGLAATYHSKTNEEGVDFILRESGKATQGLIFANLVDFDMLYGHRNDPAGFARALERFDAALPAIMETIAPGDMLILTADHGNDPVSASSDHSREYVPLLVYAPGRAGRALGVRATFADLGKTIAEYFGVAQRTFRVEFPRRGDGRMMSRPDPLQFDAVVGRDGQILMPEDARAALVPHAGSRVRVRLVPAALAEELEARGVTEREIDAIAATQLEGREQVIRFLRAEGSLAKSFRVKRAGGRR